ncbi:phi13 family phage major tail protein [Enterococcus phoeniculicola]|uniref:Phi13 family phage major tail protein n=1 Tax=Enterococcus phoeniculicola ATCC BAA-412 TaxID=1158610 RepID=R3TLX3_9ENTE|nr:major tail protein [Enterococcus phoeniculicola]EOL41998.1 phi13 family phage major tail protein [Enterococcus phoeniculicola ATCC BAA-412]EOT79723.1 hypothetical protein I589_01235 [Enterococcus phoeniculicola ATCC BAA-412]OJG71783.1 phi13 family phage major tail protein [Enterococcus phoeniculicola]
METYGFSKMSVRKLDEKKQPDTTAEIYEIKGVPKEGATSSFDLTGLSKEPVKVFGSNIEYFIVRKGVGSVAANFGILDLPSKVEDKLLGYLAMDEGIVGMGENTEPPFAAAVVEAEDLYGTPIAFALTCGSFTKDGHSLATTTDEDFKPEPGEYVFSAISRSITMGEKTENLHVLRAVGKEAVDKLKTVVLGTAGEA